MHESELRDLPLFGELGKKERELLATRADEIDVPEGKVLAEQGRTAYEFFVICRGTASVERDGERVAEVGPGDFFGEVGIATHRPRNATVTARSAMCLLVITSQAFRGMERDTPSVARQVEKAVEDRRPDTPA